ncbi:MAG: hypothetical protein DRI23_00925 [Candidatus Cloacimonadota bacterium]|nr:MAG: hypothetical protein DRH79_05250 [Candidatus Cloacimonadota bacterium]RLC53222.1 MAG: hypothetical protein DRI23_00925 [Candidatus Cloacimonadota bacterium]
MGIILNNIKFEIKGIPGKGKGVYSKQFITAGTEIFYHDLNELPKLRLHEIDDYIIHNTHLDGDHTDYVGNGFYVIDMSPVSYMNHSCNPNCVYKFQTIAKKFVIALRDIKSGEELTHDYTACSIDQFDKVGHWVLQCECGSSNCRRIITGDFLQMPEDWQRKYYRYLPRSVQRKFHLQFSLE